MVIVLYQISHLNPASTLIQNIFAKIFTSYAGKSALKVS